MVDHSLLRNGNKVLVDNQPYVIMDTDFVNPGKGQAFTKITVPYTHLTLPTTPRV